MRDTKYTVAIHILVMLATSPRDLNSDDLARSVGTNASYIRKVMALLKDHGIIASQRGKFRDTAAEAACCSVPAGNIPGSQRG